MDNASYLTYLNDTLARFEGLIYHELGGIANSKVDYIGVDFIRAKKIKGDTQAKVVEACIKEIVGAGIAKKITYHSDDPGVFLKLDITDCVHLPAKTQVKKEGVPPYLCPITNMVLDSLIEVLGYEHVHLAELQVDEKNQHCRSICAVYSSLDKIGQVSDWSKLIDK